MSSAGSPKYVLLYDLHGSLVAYSFAYDEHALLRQIQNLFDDGIFQFQVKDFQPEDWT